MPFFDEAMRALTEYRSLTDAVGRSRLPAGVTGVSHIHKVHLIHTLCADMERGALVVVPDEGEAARMAEDFAAMGDEALLYPVRDFNFYKAAASRDYEQQRLNVLGRVVRGERMILLACPEALSQVTLPPPRMKRGTFTLCAGDRLSPQDAVQRLQKAGFVRAEQVEGPGQYALRGGILDFFPCTLPQPVRAEFWGDEIDTLSVFDIESQRRIDTIKCAMVMPAAESLFSCTELAEVIGTLLAGWRGRGAQAGREKLETDRQLLQGGVFPDGMDRFLPLMEGGAATLLDYLPATGPDAPLLFVSETLKVKERARGFDWQQAEDIKMLLETGTITPKNNRFHLDFSELLTAFEQRGAVYLDVFSRGSYDTPVRELVTVGWRQTAPATGGVKQLVEDIAPALSKGYAVTVLAGGEKAARLLAEDIRRAGVASDFEREPRMPLHNKVTVTTGGLSAGFDYPQARLMLTAFGSAAAAKKRARRVAKASVGAFNSLEELHTGDYVVHAAHGIGVFDGIQKLDVQGVSKDYIKIRYAGEDVLYVPVTQLDLVSKYIGPSGEGERRLRLSRLGGSEWQKTRARVKKAVKDMAKQLIAVYSARMSTPGHAFSEDTDLQNDFERRFEYEETADQLRCIDEIKADMERPVPMDRLLCGDVGFGKTEVALRAAFKCISDGMQCALLVPTTILAWQHYQTILRRMEGMPINADLLSRFRTPRQQEESLRRLRRGQTDIIVGTHRLLSKDVQFANLGLLIVDEEQRFGVAQKVRLKELFHTVDALTLSATPIPRTLNMALSGLRDMSLIEEAPSDRYPVQTYVLEHDTGLLLEALRREIRRGGQAYYLHNRVESIEKIAVRIAHNLPEARVGVAHGKMGEEALGDVWKKLLDHDIDVLVCTTIIETGVDVPNVNTLVIEDADRMGLAQLHQLRGRVGRSSRRAYAYLTFRPGRVLSDIATKRLEAIREFTEFGSGMKIAMRDLEIRGAGSVLGAEQHGQMESVGYDMYIRMLSEAVSEEKGEKPAIPDQCTVDVQIEAHIPESYIPQLKQRIGMYRRMADIHSEDDAMDVRDELIDRFGDPPDSVLGLIDVALMRSMASSLGIGEVTQKERTMLYYQKELDVDTAGRLMNHLRGRVLVNAGNRPYVAVKMLPGQPPLDALRETLTLWSGIKQEKTSNMTTNE